MVANIALVVLGLTRTISFRELDRLTPEQIGVITVTQDVTLAVVLLVLLRAWPKVRPAELGFGAPPSPGLALAVGSGLWLLSFVIAEAQASMFGDHPQSLIIAASANRSVVGLAIYLVLGAALVGVVEELFFRAVLFTLFRQRMRFIYAALVSSVVFALVHEITAWLPVFAVGMSLAFLYERRHSLWTNALAHGTFNAISFVLLFLLPSVGS